MAFHYLVSTSALMLFHSQTNGELFCTLGRAQPDKYNLPVSLFPHLHTHACALYSSSELNISSPFTPRHQFAGSPPGTHKPSLQK